MAYTQDQVYPAGQDNDDLGVGKLRISATNNLILGQSFTPSTTSNLNAFAFMLKRIGSPSGNIWIEIHADGADPTAASLLGTSNTINATSGIGTAYDWVHFTFNTPISLTGSTVYWALLYGDYSVGASDNVFMGIDTSSPSYAGGSYGRYGNGGAAWETLSSYDALFREYTDSGSSLFLLDKTSNHNDIVFNAGGIASSSVPGTLSGAQFSAELDVNDFMWVANSASIQLTGNVTIEAWGWNDGNEGMIFWSKYGQSGNFGYSAYVQGDESIIFNASTNGSTNWAEYSASSVFELSQWHHYALVYNTATPSITGYKDGVEVSLPNTVGTVTSGIFSSTDFAKIFNTNSSSGTARYCDIRIWNTARSGAEISTNYQTLLTGSESGLVANYQFVPFVGANAGTAMTGFM